MMTFAEAEALFATAKFAAAGKPLAKHLRLMERGPDCFAVRHHSTDIVLIYRDGSYVLDNGGWWSVTTKKHLNTYGPLRIYQSKGVWFCDDGGEFRCPMRVSPKGTLSFPGSVGLRVIAGGAL
jgi:hypothetical protein